MATSTRGNEANSLTNAEWRNISQETATGFSCIDRGNTEEGLEHLRNAWIVCNTCRCCTRHEGSRPVSHDRIEQTPPDSSGTPGCGCRCRMVMRMLSAFHWDGEYYGIRSYVRHFADVLSDATEMSRYDFNDYYGVCEMMEPNEAEEFLQDDESGPIQNPDSEDYSDNEAYEVFAGNEYYNRPVLEPGIQKVKPDDDLEPEIIRGVNTVYSQGVFSSKCVRMGDNDSNGLPTYTSDEVHGLVAFGMDVEPVCTWWGSDGESYLAVLKKYEHGNDLHFFRVIR